MEVLEVVGELVFRTRTGALVWDYEVVDGIGYERYNVALGRTFLMLENDAAVGFTLCFDNETMTGELCVPAVRGDNALGHYALETLWRVCGVQAGRLRKCAAALEQLGDALGLGAGEPEATGDKSYETI